MDAQGGSWLAKRDSGSRESARRQGCLGDSQP